ncbi:hypothetical protein EJ110_NYTH25821 [Nymphaea thermarum]|nr:hypothetical protein EJ110_NYTH25821 [Nymphaea thermarum]
MHDLIWEEGGHVLFVGAYDQVVVKATTCLLDTNDHAAEEILAYKEDIRSNDQLYDIVKEYFDLSYKTLDFLFDLQRRVNELKGKLAMLSSSLQHPTSRETKVLALEKFRDCEGFNADLISSLTNVITAHTCFLVKLQGWKDKSEKRINILRRRRKMIYVLFVTVFVCAVVCSILAAALHAPPLLAALPAAAVTLTSWGPLTSWVENLWKGEENNLLSDVHIAERVKRSNSVVIHELKGIELSVKALMNQKAILECNTEFVLGTADDNFILNNMKSIVETSRPLIERMDKLDEQVTTCCSGIENRRSEILERIKNGTEPQEAERGRGGALSMEKEAMGIKCFLNPCHSRDTPVAAGLYSTLARCYERACNDHAAKEILVYKKDIRSNNQLYDIVKEYFNLSYKTLRYLFGLQRRLIELKGKLAMLSSSFQHSTSTETKMLVLEKFRDCEGFNADFLLSLMNVITAHTSFLGKLQGWKDKSEKRIRVLRRRRKMIYRLRHIHHRLRVCCGEESNLQTDVLIAERVKRSNSVVIHELRGIKLSVKALMDQKAILESNTEFVLGTADDNFILNNMKSIMERSSRLIERMDKLDKQVTTCCSGIENRRSNILERIRNCTEPQEAETAMDAFNLEQEAFDGEQETAMDSFEGEQETVMNSFGKEEDAGMESKRQRKGKSGSSSKAEGSHGKQMLPVAAGLYPNLACRMVSALEKKVRASSSSLSFDSLTQATTCLLDDTNDHAAAREILAYREDIGSNNQLYAIVKEYFDHPTSIETKTLALEEFTGCKGFNAHLLLSLMNLITAHTFMLAKLQGWTGKSEKRIHILGRRRKMIYVIFVTVFVCAVLVEHLDVLPDQTGKREKEAVHGAIGACECIPHLLIHRSVATDRHQFVSGATEMYQKPAPLDTLAGNGAWFSSFVGSGRSTVVHQEACL